MTQLPLAERSALEEQWCKADRKYLFERHFVIHNKRGQLQLLSPLRLAQKKAIAVIQWQRENNQPVRVIIGKSRKQGCSTAIVADQYTEVIEKDINAMVIAHQKELSQRLLDITHRFHRYLDHTTSNKIPPISKPELKGGGEKTSKEELRFKDREGMIWIGTAENIFAGTGMTPQYLLCSEMSKWSKGAKTAIALFQSVATLPNTSLIIECTFNGHDALFLPYWEGAYENSKLEFEEDSKGNLKVAKFEVTNPREWNHFVPIFISVLDDEEARKPFFDETEQKRFEGTLDNYEKMLINTMSAPLEYLNWRRMTLKLQCQNRIEIYKQEYPATPEEAVQASGASRFDIETLDLMQGSFCEDGQHGYLRHASTWDKKLIWERDSGGDMIRYREPIPNHRYIISCDTATGKMDKHEGEYDETVVHVYDFDHGMEQVAVIYGKIEEDHIITPLDMLSRYYNMAYDIIENNSGGKHVATEMGKIYPGNHLWREGQWDYGIRALGTKIGFNTHAGTKPRMIAMLSNAIDERRIVFRCKRTYKELKSFIRAPGGGEAEAGGHDDHVIAAGMAVVYARYFPVDRHKRKTEDPIEKLYKNWHPVQTRRGVDAITGY